MPDGGKITLGFMVNGGELRVEMMDTGKGIAPEILPQLFQPFATHGKTARHRSRPFDLQADHRGSWRPHLGAQRSGTGRHLSPSRSRCRSDAATPSLPALQRTQSVEARSSGIIMILFLVPGWNRISAARRFRPVFSAVHLPLPDGPGAGGVSSMSSEKREYPTVYDIQMALSAYARESRAPFQNLRQGLREVVRRIYSDAPVLEQELKEIQRRLGTPDERPDDMTARHRDRTPAHQHDVPRRPHAGDEQGPLGGCRTCVRQPRSRQNRPPELEQSSQTVSQTP